MDYTKLSLFQVLTVLRDKFIFFKARHSHCF